MWKWQVDQEKLLYVFNPVWNENICKQNLSAFLWKESSFLDPILGVYVKKNHLENINEIESSLTGGSVYQFYVC